MASILLIEADQLTLTLLKGALKNQGYFVGIAINFSNGLAQASDYDLILLNPKLAELDKIHPCQQLRSQGYHKPILLLLEAASTEGISGLDAGADDYVVKPYKMPDLLAHIRALLRRQDAVLPPSRLQWGELMVESHSATVTYRGELLALTPKEFRLLELFLRHPKRVFSRTAILDHIWGFASIPHENTVTNHIKELRQKLKAAGMTVDILETIYGLGYRLKPAPEPSLASTTSRQDFSPVPTTGGLDSFSPRVLIVDDDSTICSALEYLLQPWGFHVTALEQPERIWDILADVTPDLLILDLELAQSSGIELCRQVRQHPRWGNLLILAITSDTTAEAIQWAFVAGADDFVSKPIVDPELVTRVASRLEQRRSRPPWSSAMTTLKPSQSSSDPGSIQPTYGNILLVDDQPDNLQTLSKILSRQGYKVRKALRGTTALKTAQSQKPDLIVLDIRMPEMNGYEVCAALKAHAATRDIPILFLSALDDTADKLKAFAVGGVDYITKPFHSQEVLARIKHQLTILQQKRQLTERNRQLQREIQARQQSQSTLEQMQVALQDSNARFELLFDQMAIALALIGRDDRWLRINPALSTLLGFPAAELLQRPISDCLEILPQESGALAWDNLYTHGKFSEPVEMTCRSKLGLTIRLSLRVWAVDSFYPSLEALLVQFQALPTYRLQAV